MTTINKLITITSEMIEKRLFCLDEKRQSEILEKYNTFFSPINMMPEDEKRTYLLHIQFLLKSETPEQVYNRLNTYLDLLPEITQICDMPAFEDAIILSESLSGLSNEDLYFYVKVLKEGGLYLRIRCGNTPTNSIAIIKEMVKKTKSILEGREGEVHINLFQNMFIVASRVVSKFDKSTLPDKGMIP